MKFCATCKLEKPESAFSRKADAKDGLYPHCKACKVEKDRAYRVANHEKLLAHDKARYLDRAEQQKAAAINRYRANSEDHKAAMQIWSEQNRDRSNAIKKAYKARNPGKTLAAIRKRQTRKMQAMPAWSNEFFIEEAYNLAKLREQITGGKWHVDHVIPLQGKTVCGLHVETNLQVIPAVLNMRKHNKMLHQTTF